MNKNNKLEKFRQRKAQEFFTQELPNRLKGFKAALEGTPEEIKKKLDDQEEIYVLDFWDKLDEITEQEKKTLELVGKTADILCKGEERSLASEIIADQSAEIEKLKAELQETEELRDLYYTQKSVATMQLDIINFVSRIYSKKTLSFIYGVVKSTYKHQIEEEQEDESNGEM